MLRNTITFLYDISSMPWFHLWHGVQAALDVMHSHPLYMCHSHSGVPVLPSVRMLDVRQMPWMWGRCHLCSICTAALPLVFMCACDNPSACIQEWCDGIVISHLTDRMAWSAWQHFSHVLVVIRIQCVVYLSTLSYSSYLLVLPVCVV